MNVTRKFLNEKIQADGKKSYTACVIEDKTTYFVSNSLYHTDRYSLRTESSLSYSAHSHKSIFDSEKKAVRAIEKAIENMEKDRIDDANRKIVKESIIEL